MTEREGGREGGRKEGKKGSSRRSGEGVGGKRERPFAFCGKFLVAKFCDPQAPV